MSTTKNAEATIIKETTEEKTLNIVNTWQLETIEINTETHKTINQMLIEKFKKEVLFSNNRYQIKYF